MQTITIFSCFLDICKEIHIPKHLQVAATLWQATKSSAVTLA